MIAKKHMNSLNISDKHYDRKVLDLQRRYDEEYDRIEDIFGGGYCEQQNKRTFD